MKKAQHLVLCCEQRRRTVIDEHRLHPWECREHLHLHRARLYHPQDHFFKDMSRLSGEWLDDPMINRITHPFRWPTMAIKRGPAL
jgi:hypothetical protein